MTSTSTIELLGEFREKHVIAAKVSGRRYIIEVGAVLNGRHGIQLISSTDLEFTSTASNALFVTQPDDCKDVEITIDNDKDGNEQ